MADVPTMNLRFIERDNQRILQQMFLVNGGPNSVWLDVPVVDEHEDR